MWMFSLKKDRETLFSSNSVDELVRYLEKQCTEFELKYAKELFKSECVEEYGRMWHLCLIDSCERLEGVSLLIHQEV